MMNRTPLLFPGPSAGRVRRRPARALAVLLLSGAAWLAGCAGGSPPARLYQLRAEAPEAAAPVAATSAVLQMGPVQVPAYLDQDTLLVPTGQAGLQQLIGHRWAEPLRDAVPRLLQQDLARLLGADKVWGRPLPAGVRPTLQLRVELQRLDADPGGAAVGLQARWTLTDPAGTAPARVQEARLSAPTGGTSPDALVAAHRRALWMLAQRIAASVAAP